MTLAAEDSSADLRLKRNLVMLTAIITDDLKSLLRLIAFRRLPRPAFRTSLGRHHVALVEDLLFFFSEEKRLLTLNADRFDVRHFYSLLNQQIR